MRNSKTRESKIKKKHETKKAVGFSSGLFSCFEK